MREATHFKGRRFRGACRRARRTRAGIREARESCYQSAAHSKKPGSERRDREDGIGKPGKLPSEKSTWTESPFNLKAAGFMNARCVARG